METKYVMNAEEARKWRARRERGIREHIRDMARLKASEKGADVVNIETPTGLIVDTLVVA